MPPNRSISRTMMERSQRAIGRLMKDRNFSSIDEMNAFLEKNVLGKRLEEYQPVSDDPKEQAQALAFDAMDAESLSESIDLVRRALELDPENVDALLLLAQCGQESFSKEAYIEKLRSIVDTGARELGGAGFFEEHRGHFWGRIETRPYMRARAELAGTLEAAGRDDEAAREYEAMLELNPGDNQGIREPLLGVYLKTGRLDDARRLLEIYQEDGSAVMMWGAVFLHYLAGDKGKAVVAFRRARKRNRHVVAFLTGKRGAPVMADYYRLGDESEGLHCAAMFLDTVKQNPELILWLEKTNKKLV